MRTCDVFFGFYLCILCHNSVLLATGGETWSIKHDYLRLESGLIRNADGIIGYDKSIR